jgi:tetratricopeptide (TPR) repeat protein
VRIHPHDLLLQEPASACPEVRAKCLKHLAKCSKCQDKLRWLLHLRPTPLASKVLPFERRQALPTGYDPLLANASRSLAPVEGAYARERAEAPGLYAELMQVPAGRRTLLVRNCPRFQTWGLCERLLHESQEQNFQDPALGESLALLAVEVLDYLDGPTYGTAPVDDLRARAWAYVANSRRVRSDLQGAEEAFDFAFSFLRLGTGDSMEKALVLDLKASLLMKQGRLPEALRLLRRSMIIFLEFGETHRAGRALVRTSSAHSLAGEPQKGIALLYRALDLIDPTREPRLRLIAWHNLIDNLTETGQFMAAQKLLVKAKPLYQKFPQPWFLNPRKWIEGKIARGLGQIDQAEILLLEARDGFLLMDAVFDTALVSLELAALYAEQGRMAELKCLAEQIVQFFSSRQVHREALAALDYWQQAVEAEQACAATATLIAGIASFLRQAEHNPNLRFQRPE